MQPPDAVGPSPEHHRHQLDRLRREGGVLGADRSLSADDPAVRSWQQRCADIVGKLSGGSKSHWLARAYSEAFLVASTGADAAAGVTPDVSATLIVERMLTVLDRASASLARLERDGHDDGPVDAAASTERFAFIVDTTLRSGLAEVDRSAQDAFDRGAYPLALVSTCSVLESVITDALQRIEPSALAAHGAPDAPIATWSFDRRIAVAATARCISAGCARLPDSARRYREFLDVNGDVKDGIEVSEQDARRAGQVLRVILRDLAPGR